MSEILLNIDTYTYTHNVTYTSLLEVVILLYTIHIYRATYALLLYIACFNIILIVIILVVKACKSRSTSLV